MTRIIKTILMLLIKCSLIAGTALSENLPVNYCKIVEFNSMLKEFDLNTKTQNGYSITETEYFKLLSEWDLLSQQEKIQILNGTNKYSWKNTMALVLLYSFSNKEDWKRFIENISNYNSKGNSLTLSSVKSTVALKTVHHTLLDLLQKDLKMFKNESLNICPAIKSAAVNRKNQNACTRLQKWEDLINQCMSSSLEDKIRIVNEFFNEIIEAKPDNENKGNRDYWQSPIETLVRGKGDCEDFALAKYVSLRILGIPESQLFIGIIRLPQFGELHAVLMYYPLFGNDPYLLDNLLFDYNGFKISHLVKLSFRISQHNIKPLIAFNENQYIEFKRGLTRKYLNKNPMTDIPMFSIAINNSQSLLSNLPG